MELTQLRIGFPVLRIETCVFHATPRSPTAFERVLIGLCNRFGRNSTYNTISLESIFADILGVAAPASVLLPTLRELISLDVIRCQGNVDALDTLALRAIEITERGRLMLAEDMLPAMAQENTEIFDYDPVRKRLLSSSESKACRPQSPATALDPHVFEEIFPEELIRAHILECEFPWWNKSSRIERIERNTVSVLWRDTPASVVIENNALRIALKDTDQTAYINSLTAEEIYARFLKSAFESRSLSDEVLAGFTPCDVENITGTDARWMPIASALGEFPGKSRFWLVDQSFQQPSTRQEPAVAAPHQAIIHFNGSQASEGIQLTWNESKDGCIVLVNTAYPIEDALIASDQFLLRGRRIRVNLGRDSFELPLVLQCDCTQNDPGVEAALVSVGKALRGHKTESHAIVPALWESETDFWRDYATTLKSRQLTIPEAIDELQLTKIRFIELAGKMQPATWDKAVSDTVCGLMQSTDLPITVEYLKSVIVSVGQCGLTTSEFMSLIVSVLGAKLEKPRTLAEFAKIRAALNVGGAPWKMPYPSCFYTPEILSALTKVFPSALLLECFSDGNAFDQVVCQLLQINKTLNRHIGGRGISSLSDDDSYRNLLKQRNITRIAEESEAWNSHYITFVKTYPEIQAHLGGTPLADTNLRIQQILTLSRKLIGGLDPRFRSVFVIDTSALLGGPSIMEAFRPGDYVVVSKRVIEELDDKKSEESLRPRVADATRALRSFPKHQIQFCDGDMSLLPPDYRLKGDNLILSVAIRYRKHGPVLLTNDNNLALKAKAEDIAAMSVNEFLHRAPRNHVQSEEMTTQPHNTIIRPPRRGK